MRYKKARTARVQIYLTNEMTKNIDKICEKEGIFRSHFVEEAIDRALKRDKFQKILRSKNE